MGVDLRWAGIQMGVYLGGQGYRWACIWEGRDIDGRVFGRAGIHWVETG